jgi:hypothetical protein
MGGLLSPVPLGELRCESKLAKFNDFTNSEEIVLSAIGTPVIILP